MKRSWISYAFLLSFLQTVTLLFLWQQAAYPLVIWTGLLIAAIVAGVAMISGMLRNMAILTLAIVLGISASLWSVARTTHVTGPGDVEMYAGQKSVTLHGWISAEPDKRPMQTKYVVSADILTDASGTVIPVTGKVLFNDSVTWPDYPYGQEVTLHGQLERPGKIDSFSYDAYLSLSGIYAVMYRGNIRAVKDGTDQANPVLAFLFNSKRRFENQINRIYPEPHASLLAGLLTGSRRGIPDDILASFRTTGLTHIIAISGYNITIIITLLSGMLCWMPVRLRFVPLTAGIILFTLFVGASASVVRAAVMGILGLIALQAGRKTSMRLLILWTAFIMLTWNPKMLWYDAGFQLSFLALIGLTELSDYVRRWFWFLPETLGIRESLTATMAAQLSTLPVTTILFGQISFIAPVANLLVAPLIPFAMATGFIGVVLSWLYFPLGQTVSFITFGILKLLLFLVGLLGRIPFAAVSFGA